MKRSSRVAVFAGLVPVVLGASAGSPVGLFTGAADVGQPAIAGVTTYDASPQHYRMSAGGLNMWGTSDQHQFAWQKIAGDFIVRARVEHGQHRLTEPVR